MWPRQPHRKQPKGAMQVQMIWDPLLVGNGLCQPLVGFALRWHGQSRFMPFMPVDMKVDCRNLKQTDNRTYWGRADVAAAMPRFDFSASETNERSARFVVSAAWKLAKPLKIAVRQRAPLEAPQRRRVLQLLQKFGQVQVRQMASPAGLESGSGRLGVAQVSAKPAYNDLARYLARSLSAGGMGEIEGHIDDVADGFPDVVVELGVMPSRAAAPPPAAAPEAPEAPETAPSAPTTAPPPNAQRYLPSAMPPDRPATPPPPPSAPAAPRYIDSWQPPLG